MQNNAFLSLMGIARKANKLTFGANDTLEALKKGKIRLVAVASDISAKTEKEMRFAAGNVPVVRTAYSLEETSAAIGRIAGVLGITDQGFAAKSEQLLK